MTTHTKYKHKFMTTPNGRIPTGKSEHGRKVRSGDETVQFWIEGIYERESRGYVDATSIIARGDTIYSYGTHFPMAKIMRDAKGKAVSILVSADTWQGGGWTSTGQHQGMVRSAVNAHAPNLGLPVLEIPFSVLDAANIDYASIRVIESRDSRYTEHEITSPDCPGVRGYARDEDGTVVSIHPYTGVCLRKLDPNLSSVDYERSGMAHAHARGHAELREDGLWHWTVERHWMGDSLIRAKSTEVRTRKPTADELAIAAHYADVRDMADRLADAYRESFVSGVGYDERYHEWSMAVREYSYELQSELPDGWRSGNERRGEVPTVAFHVQRWATYLSSFDYNEPHRPYFFCEMPYGCKAQTVDEAVDALMPSYVRWRIEQGDDVLRQGDVFAVPTDLTTDELESVAETVEVSRYDVEGAAFKVPVTIRRRGANESYPSGALDILGTNHQATHVIKTKDGWYGRGRMYHSPRFRGPDHRVVKLEDDRWYLFVKNTVPEARTSNVGNAVASGHSRAWTTGGQVD